MGARFGGRVRAARIDAEVTLKKVADTLQFSVAYVSDIERGNRNPPAADKVAQWATLIGLPPTDLVRLAILDRESVELPLAGSATRGEIGHMLTRTWNSMSAEDENALLSQLKQIAGEHDD